MMKLLSVNVARPRDVLHQGQTVSTGIFKQPVAGRVRLRRHNLDGDGQGDLSVHGGPNKAVYAYPAEHYAFWREQLSRVELPWGMFGENFTTEGLREEEVRIGDCFRVGAAEVVVTQPRFPCVKLGIKFRRADMVKRFLASRRTGFYLAVGQEGEVGAGDTIELVAREESGLTVADIVELYVSKQKDREMLERAANLAALPEGWRDVFRKRLEKRDK